MKPNGMGEGKYSSGNAIRGERKDGNRQGTVVFTWNNGDVYEGGWSFNKPNGHREMNI